MQFTSLSVIIRPLLHASQIDAKPLNNFTISIHQSFPITCICKRDTNASLHAFVTKRKRHACRGVRACRLRSRRSAFSAFRTSPSLGHAHSGGIQRSRGVHVLGQYVTLSIFSAEMCRMVLLLKRTVVVLVVGLLLLETLLAAVHARLIQEGKIFIVRIGVRIGGSVRYDGFGRFMRENSEVLWLQK